MYALVNISLGIIFIFTLSRVQFITYVGSYLYLHFFLNLCLYLVFTSNFLLTGKKINIFGYYSCINCKNMSKFSLNQILIATRITCLLYLCDKIGPSTHRHYQNALRNVIKSQFDTKFSFVGVQWSEQHLGVQYVALFFRKNVWYSGGSITSSSSLKRGKEGKHQGQSPFSASRENKLRSSKEPSSLQCPNS